MEEIVFRGINDQAMTSSLLVAKEFGKVHAKVMRDIENLNCSEEFRLANFGNSSFKNEQGKEFPMFTMTKDGFSFLVMGYTGKKAAQFKEAYIMPLIRWRPRYALRLNQSRSLRFFRCLSINS